MFFPSLRRQVAYTFENKARRLVFKPFNFVYEYYLITESILLEQKENSETIKNNILELFEPILYKAQLEQIKEYKCEELLIIYQHLIESIIADYKHFLRDDYVQRFLGVDETGSRKRSYYDEILGEEEEEHNNATFIYDIIFDIVCHLDIPDELWKVLNLQMVKYYIRKIERDKAMKSLELINILVSMLAINNSDKRSKASKTLSDLEKPYRKVLEYDKKYAKPYEEKLKEKGIDPKEVFSLRKMAEHERKKKEREKLEKMHAEKKE